MGLYSTNRIDSFNESSVEIREIMESIEETSYNPDFGDIMEVAIQIQENDQRMFDTLIECDFISAMNEAVLLEEEAEEANKAADEKKGGSLKDKIVALCTKIANAIKQAAANIIYKIKEFLKADQKLYNKYKDVLKMSNLDGFEGIKGFNYDAIVDSLNTDCLELLGKVIVNSSSFNNNVETASSKEDIDKYFEEFENNIKSSEEELSNVYKNTLSKEKKDVVWKPTTDRLNDALNVLKDGNKLIKEIKENSAKAIADLKKKAKEAKKERKNGKNEVETYMLNKKYIVASKTCSFYSKQFKMLVNASINAIAASRKVVIICGKYAAKKAGKSEEAPDKKTETEQTNESVLNWVLAESSDMYVYEYLGY